MNEIAIGLLQRDAIMSGIAIGAVILLLVIEAFRK